MPKNPIILNDHIESIEINETLDNSNQTEKIIDTIIVGVRVSASAAIQNNDEDLKNLELNILKVEQADERPL